MNDQVLIGGLMAGLCGVAFWHSRWLLMETGKGRRLIGWFGEARGLWVLRGLLAAGVAFGLLLAANVIRPVKW